MVILLGGSGYVGTAFREMLTRRSVEYMSVSRSKCDYTRADVLKTLIRETKPEFLINTAGYAGKPNVDACERDKASCLAGNAVLPGIIRSVCEDAELPWGHVSSGCIYTGARSDGSGFTETDPPNFCFRTDNCSFYSGTKALGEECLAGADRTYLWRLRIPFGHVDSPRNYLSKLQRYRRLLDARNSISHLGEFVEAAWDCWEKRATFGIYNVVNTGSVTTREVATLIHKRLRPDLEFDFFTSEEEFMKAAAHTPRSNCILDNTKLRVAGVAISHVHDALERALMNWKA